MAFDAHKNFAYSTVATAPSPAASGTSLVVAAGEGANFPAVPFNAVICPANTPALITNAEIVRVTARSTDTLTITRTQEGTSARTVLVGDQIFADITAKTLADIEGSPAFTGTVSAAAMTSAGTLQVGNWGFFFSTGVIRNSNGSSSATLQAFDVAYRQQIFDATDFSWLASGVSKMSLSAAGALTLSAYTSTTFAAGDKYLVVDASGNVHRSAIGPAS